jgi:hypothetical protein
MRKGLNNTEVINTTTGFDGIGTACKRLWPKMITSPIMPIIRDFNFNRNERTIKLRPIAEITSMIMKRKCMSNQRAKFIIVNSSTTSQMPLFRRNDLLSERLLFLLKEMKAEIPDRNTKVGAQR